MFNLLVINGAGSWDEPSYTFDKERFLEHTSEELRAQFLDLGDAAVGTLTQLPTLFAYERDVGQPARVGWIKTVEKDGHRIQITLGFDPEIQPIDPARIEALSAELELNKLEMYRTHWALKRGDLLDVLRGAGLASRSGMEPAKPITLTRGTIIAASDALQNLGHAGLDRFLMEMGIEAINAGRGVGGLQPRVNAIAHFVLQHKDLRTADGERIDIAVLKKAAEADPGRQTKFWACLERDGYAVKDDRVIPIESGSIPPYARPRVASPTVPPLSWALPLTQPTAPVAPPPWIDEQKKSPAKVFLVHGRDHGSKDTVARYLERLGLEVIILHERPNQGRTLISKFREESADVGFAVVIMTPDDIGGLKPTEGQGVLNPRARQNVVFELGFFIGKLGPDRVCALVSGRVEKPSDFEAVVYVEFGPGTEWKNELARELNVAGIPFDHSKVFH
jgi:hypothetical protein